MPSIAQLLPLLGEDYERKCLELGIIQRTRAIKMPADLMTLCLFHLLNGLSLMAASAVAFTLKTGDFSDAAFMKKFAKCGEWFKQIGATLALAGSFHISNRHIEKAAACLRQARPMWQGRGGLEKPAARVRRQSFMP